MAGNASDARREAEKALKNAKDADVKGRDRDTLQATYDAARARELSETNQNEQAKSWF